MFHRSYLGKLKLFEVEKITSRGVISWRAVLELSRRWNLVAKQHGRQKMSQGFTFYLISLFISLGISSLWRLNIIQVFVLIIFQPHSLKDPKDSLQKSALFSPLFTACCVLNSLSHQQTRMYFSAMLGKYILQEVDSKLLLSSKIWVH